VSATSSTQTPPPDSSVEPRWPAMPSYNREDGMYLIPPFPKPNFSNTAEQPRTRISNPGSIPTVQLELGADARGGIGIGAEGLKSTINLTGLNTQFNYNFTNQQYNFLYGAEIGTSPEVDFNPVTAGHQGNLFYQRYCAARDNDTWITGIRYGAQVSEQVGVKVAAGAGVSVKEGFDRREMTQVEATFKNGSWDRLSAWDRINLSFVNPVPSFDRARELARENPSLITVTERQRIPLKLFARGAVAGSAYVGAGGKLSGYGGIAVTTER
jgi:hypothetical protein